MRQKLLRLQTMAQTDGSEFVAGQRAGALLGLETLQLVRDKIEMLIGIHTTIDQQDLILKSIADHLGNILTKEQFNNLKGK
jgi:hypothetical protein